MHKRVEPHWNWAEGKTISVNAFSNCGEVELFLNNRSLGNKKMTEYRNRTISWEVPYEKGILRAVARNNGKEAASFELNTTGSPVKINATTDADISPASSGRGEIKHVYVTLCDDAGNIVYSARNEVTCEIAGPVRLLGMEDSNPSNIEDYKDNRQHAFHGKLLIYLMPVEKGGKATITLSSPGLEQKVLEIDLK
jgi:hypothetical protein